MPKRNSTASPTDVNQLAYFLVQQSTQEPEAENIPTTRPPVSKAISRVMSKMGIRGGKIGGKRRLITMTPEHRSEVAAKAARARWAKQKGQV